MYKYYLTKRPATPGAIPAGATSVKNYDKKTYIEIIGREAWAVVVYSEELTKEAVDNYELTPEQIEPDRRPLEIKAGKILMNQGKKGREALQMVQTLTIKDLIDIIGG